MNITLKEDIRSHDSRRVRLYPNWIYEEYTMEVATALLDASRRLSSTDAEKYKVGVQDSRFGRWEENKVLKYLKMKINLKC